MEKTIEKKLVVEEKRILSKKKEQAGLKHKTYHSTQYSGNKGDWVKKLELQ